MVHPCRCEPGTQGWFDPSDLVTWAFVVGGWLVVHLMTVLRARRQEEKEAIVALEERIVALRGRATAHFTSDRSTHDAHAEAAHIRFELKSLAHAISVLRPSGDLAGELIYLRQAITTEPFDSDDYEPLLPDDERVQNVWVMADGLIGGLKEAFSKKHRLS